MKVVTQKNEKEKMGT